MSKIQESPPHLRRFPIVWLTIGFAVCNFLTVPVMDATERATMVTVLIVGPFWGAIVGQACLLAVWAVFGPGSVPGRLCLTSLLAAAFLVSFGAGAVVGSSGPDFRDIMTVPWFVPLLLMATQLPLWGVKLATGGRIVRVDANPRQSSTEGRQFGLRQMMGATVMVAVAFSLAGSGARLDDSDPSETWIPLSIACLCCILWSTFAALPCLWAGMIARRKPVAAVVIGTYTVLVTLLAWGVLRLMPRMGMLGEIVLMFFAFHASLMAVILGTLDLARRCGYTFISRSRPQLIAAAGCPFAVQDDSSGGTQAAGTPTADSGETLEPNRPFEQGAR